MGTGIGQGDPHAAPGPPTVSTDARKGAIEVFPAHSQLAHRIQVHDPSYLSGRHYDLYPIRVARPVTGQTVATVVCGTCGEEVRFIVKSDALCRVRRIKLFLVWLAGFAVLIGGLVALGYTTTVSAAATVGGFLMIPALTVVVGPMRDAWRDALEGVTIESSTHTIRSPGSFRDPPAPPDTGPNEVGI